MSSVTVRQLADELNVSTDFVYERCRRREWPHQRLGDLYRFTPTHVEQIRKLVETPAAPSSETSIPGLSQRSARNLARRLQGTPR